MALIGIVEDNKAIREELKFLLEHNNYEVELFTDFISVVEDVTKSSIDLLLLDINLPIEDGYRICRKIRKVSNLPIIVVTSRDTEMDELMAMDLGADDFVTKPYNTSILLARMQRLLLRSGSAIALRAKGAELIPKKFSLEYNGKQVSLTMTELKILSILFEKKNEVVEKSKIVDSLWESDVYLDDNTLAVNVNRIRNKLSEIGLEDLIETKRGVGYAIMDI